MLRLVFLEAPSRRLFNIHLLQDVFETTSSRRPYDCLVQDVFKTTCLKHSQGHLV